MMTADTLNALLTAYLSELLADGIDNPLDERIRLGAVVSDLYRLAGAPEACSWAMWATLATGEPVTAA